MEVRWLNSKRLVGALLSAGLLLAGAGVVHAQVAAGPTVPTNVSAVVNASNQVYVTWSASSETSTPDISYYLYRNGDEIANTPGYTYYTDPAPPGAYSYTVAAYDGSGNISKQSSPTTVVTVRAETTPPTAPTDLTATVSSSSVILSWGPSTDTFGVAGYYVYRNDQKILTANAITGTTYADTGLPEGATYTYYVVAYDSGGNISDPSNVVQETTIFDVTPPATPQALSAAAVSPTQIDLSWKPATDNVEVAGYTIWRNGTQIATIGTSTTYTDAGLSPETRYGYAVYAYDEVDNVSAEPAEADAVTPAPDTTPPSIPQNFYATPLSASSVLLTWSPSTDNVGVAGYYLYNGTTQIASTASTTYISTGLATSTTYQYFLKAYDAAGNVSPPTSVAVTTLSYNPAPVAVAAPTPTSSPVVTPAPITPAPTPAPTPSSVSVGTNDFTTNMYYGYRNASVLALQKFLITQGDLGASYATGFYGSLTQAAVKKFQCAEAIVCSGTPGTTGWGSVGPRTRVALNAL